MIVRIDVDKSDSRVEFGLAVLQKVKACFTHQHSKV